MIILQILGLAAAIIAGVFILFGLAKLFVSEPPKWTAEYNYKDSELVEPSNIKWEKTKL